MKPLMIYRDQFEVELKLNELGVNREELLEVVKKVVAARNNAVAFDPLSTKGQFGFIYGTRAIREALCPKGWVVDRKDNVESTFNPSLGVKIIYQNADSAANSEREPQSISGKGAASTKLVENSFSGYLFPEMEEEERLKREAQIKSLNATVWFLFVSVEGEEVCAELSCPRSIEDGQFKGFHERIFFLQNNEWDESVVIEDTESPLDEFEVNVSRK